MDVFKSQQLSSVGSIENVVVHPVVLLSVLDHYIRVNKSTHKRVIGALLGNSFNGTVDITNSYAVPFVEDEKEPDIWDLDHEYLEKMFCMLERINENEYIVGWYSTGPKVRENDLDIHCLFKDYVYDPILVIIDVQPEALERTIAYRDVKVIKENVTEASRRVFVLVPSEITADEIEEIGVKHLFRDVGCTTIRTLESEVTRRMSALKTLGARLKVICQYLDLVVDGKLPLNHEILYHLQEVFMLLPNLNVPDLIKAFAVKTSEQMLAIYLSSLIRSVIALHNLIINREHEKAEDAAGC